MESKYVLKKVLINGIYVEYSACFTQKQVGLKHLYLGQSRDIKTFSSTIDISGATKKRLNIPFYFYKGRCGE